MYSDILIHINRTHVGFLFPNMLARKKKKSHTHARSKQIIYLIQCKYTAKFTARDVKLLM